MQESFTATFKIKRTFFYPGIFIISNILLLISFFIFDLSLGNFLKIHLFYFLPLMATWMFAFLTKAKTLQNYLLLRVIVPFALALLSWAGASMGLSWLNAIFFYVLMACVWVGILLKKREWKQLPKSAIIYYELFGFLLFQVLLISICFHPHLSWGEKPMDMSLLSYFKRYQGGSVEDVWAAGTPLKYYYLGYFMWGLIGKAAFLSTPLVYWSALGCTLSLSYFALLYLLSILTNNKHNQAHARFVFYAIFLLGAGNLASFNAIFSGFSFSSFWQATRVFPDGLFAEFPSWAFMFGDLHPHIMAFPLSLVLIGNFFHFFYSDQMLKSRRQTFWRGMLPGAILGALIMFNIWDAVILPIFFLGPLLIWRKLIFQKLFSRYFLAGGLLSLLMFVPFFWGLNSGGRSKLGPVVSHYHPFLSFFLHQGHWAILFLFIFLQKQDIKVWSRSLRSWYMLLVFLLLAYLILSFAPGIIAYVCMLGVVFFILIKTRCYSHFFGYKSELNYSGIFLGLLLLLIFSDFFIVMDRINTVFKFRTWTFTLSGILFLLLFDKFKMYKNKIAMMALILFMFSSSSLNYLGLIRYSPNPKATPSLHGLTFLQQDAPSTFDLITYMQENIKGLPIMLEAPGRSFKGEFSRVSSYTGIPSILGWEGHVNIRGLPYLEGETRRKKINAIYRSLDPIWAYQALSELGVQFLVISQIETGIYSATQLQKFFQYQDLFHLLYKNKEAYLFGINDFRKYLK